MEDLVSIAFSAVITAIDKFDITKKKNFYMYWLQIAKNAMKKYFKESKKLYELDSKISLDDETESGHSLHDSITSDDVDKEISIYNSLISIINDERCKLTALEKMVISLSLDGYDIKEISKILSKNKTTIYRNYHSAINKIRHSIIDKK